MAKKRSKRTKKVWLSRDKSAAYYNIHLGATKPQLDIDGNYDLPECDVFYCSEPFRKAVNGDLPRPGEAIRVEIWFKKVKRAKP